MARAEALLKHLGLTEYESRAFLSLVANGSQTADKISTHAKIPLPRVYDTMASLSARGLIMATKTRPQMFKVISLDRVSLLLQEDEKKKMEERVKTIEETVPQLLKEVEHMPKKKGDDFDDAFAYVRRRVNMNNFWESAHNSAKKEILLFAGNLYWTDKMSDTIKKSVKKGVKYKIIWSVPSKNVIPRIKKLTSMGVDMRFSAKVGPLRGIVCDRNKLFIAKVPDEGEAKTDLSDFITLIITDKVILDVFNNYFDNLWKASESTKTAIKRIK